MLLYPLRHGYAVPPLPPGEASGVIRRGKWGHQERQVGSPGEARGILLGEAIEVLSGKAW